MNNLKQCHKIIEKIHVSAWDGQHYRGTTNLFLSIVLLIFFASCDKKPKERPDSPLKIDLSVNNIGHRMGGDIFDGKIPENTLDALRASFQYRNHHNFKYWELDVHETKDNILIVFHDKKIKGFGKIKDLNYSDIFRYRIDGKYQIPTLKLFLDELVKLKNDKRLLIEIKNLHSDKGRNGLIEMVDSFRDKGFEIAYLAFKDKFKKSFPDKKKWCSKLKLVHKTGKKKTEKNNRCEKYLDKG